MGQSKNKILLKKIALRIKEIRNTRNITLEQFYFDTGIHLARIEAGDSNVTVSTLHTICQYFELSLEDFFKGLK